MVTLIRCGFPFPRQIGKIARGNTKLKQILLICDRIG